MPYNCRYLKHNVGACGFSIANISSENNTYVVDVFEEPEVGRKPAVRTADCRYILVCPQSTQCSLFAFFLLRNCMRIDVGKVCMLDAEQICGQSRTFMSC